MRTALQAWMRASAFVAVSWQALGATACSQAKDAAPPLLADCDGGTKCGTTTGGTSGGGGTPSDGGGNASCGVIPFPSMACTACAKARCCARNATCSDNPVCLAVWRCIGMCAVGDSMCVLMCRDQMQTQNGVPDYDNFTDCVTSGCSTECAAMDAGRSCGVLDFGNAACVTCANTNCCTESATCSNNPDCIALAQCTKPCSTPLCLSDCQEQHQIGASDYRAVSQCVQGSCAAQCP